MLCTNAIYSECSPDPLWLVIDPFSEKLPINFARRRQRQCRVKKGNVAWSRPLFSIIDFWQSITIDNIFLSMRFLSISDIDWQKSASVIDWFPISISIDSRRLKIHSVWLPLSIITHSYYSKTITTTSTRFSQYYVVLAREPASFCRETVIAIFILLLVWARMSC